MNVDEVIASSRNISEKIGSMHFRNYEVFSPPYKSILDIKVEPIDQTFPVNKIRNSHEYVDYVARLLHHVAANPTKELNSNLILDSYVIGVVDQGVSHDKYLNSSNDRIDKFAKQLIRASKQYFAKPVSGSLNDSVYVIHGKRGCGKTSFLNYLITNYSDEYNNAGVVVARIDLNKQHTEKSLITSVNQQLSKLILRYYSTDSEFVDESKKQFALSGLERKIVSNFENAPDYHKLPSRSDLTAIFRTWQMLGVDRPLSEANMPEVVATEIVRVASQEYRRKYLVIFDGVDILEADFESAEKFRSYITQCVEVVKESRFGPVVLTTRRTQKEMWQAGIYPNVFTFRRENHFDIGLSKLEDILQKRIDAIIKCLSNRSVWEDEEDALEVGNRLRDFKSHLSLPIEDAEGKEIADSKYSYLDKISGSNRRAQMSEIAVDFIEGYEDGVRQSTAYRILENLLLSNYRYPLPHFSFFECDNGEMDCRRTGHSDRYDLFFPNIYLYPCSLEISPVNFPGRRDLMLLQLRILEILRIHELWQEKDDSVDSITVNDVTDVMEIYGYEAQRVKMQLRVMDQFELVEREFCGNYLDMDMARVNMGYKGRYLLENVAFDIAYLSLCSTNLLVNDGNEAARKMFNVATPRTCSSNSQWSQFKIENSITMWLIIVGVARAQIDRLCNHKKFESELLNTLLSKVATEGEFCDMNINRKQDYISNQIFGNLCKHNTNIDGMPNAKTWRKICQRVSDKI